MNVYPTCSLAGTPGHTTIYPGGILALRLPDLGDPVSLGARCRYIITIAPDGSGSISTLPLFEAGEEITIHTWGPKGVGPEGLVPFEPLFGCESGAVRILPGERRTFRRACQECAGDPEGWEEVSSG